MHPKTKNEFQFEQWLFEQYGMTSKEKTENTLMGNLNVLLEVSDVIDIAALPVGAIAVGAKLVGKKVIKEVGEELGEKAVKELGEETKEKLAKETTEKATKDIYNKENLLTGEEWNSYFREKYGYDNVNWDTAFSSPNDIADIPSNVTRMNPDGLNNYLNKNGIETKPLGQGHLSEVPYENGGGFNAHYNSNYGETYIQYHPGNGHHGEKAYYKVSSSNTFSYSGKETGTQRFNLDGTVMK